MWTPLALAALALAAPFQQPGPGTVQGEVRSELTGEPIPFAVVEVVGALVPLVVSADSLGNYLLREVPAGRRLLRARSLDHSPLEVEVLIPARQVVRVDFGLRLQPVALPGLTVQEAGAPRSGEQAAGGEPELGRAVVRSLEATSGMAELGLAEMARMAPPGQEPVDPSSVLYVRGAPADLKLVLLDGAPVYAPFHAGGLLPAFEPELVGRADLYLGGAPARYNGGLSYVLDLETRTGSRTGARASGMVDLLTAQTLIESPVGARTSLLLGARAVHGLGADWFLREQFPYGYGDLVGRADLAIGGQGTLGVTGFWNRESIRLGDDPATRAEEAIWGNTAGSVRYRGPILGRDAELTAATGVYRAQLPIGDAGRRVVADGAARQTRLAAELSGGSAEARVHYGISYERTVLEQRAWAGPGGLNDSDLAGSTLLEATATGEAGGVYADLDWGMTPRVRVRGGLRADLYSMDTSVRLAPRLSVNWAVSDRVVLLIAGGQYRQFVRVSTEVLPESEKHQAVHAPRSLRLAQASHLLVALDQLLADEIRFGIEGYFKRFEGVPTDIGAGSANASGVDLWLRRGEGRVNGWLGYSLGWVWTAPPSGEATDLFSGRQLLSLGLAGEIGAGGRVALRVGYGAGIPYAAIPDATQGMAPSERLSSYTGPLSSARDMTVDAPLVATAPDAPYLRLDAEVSYPWATEWGGARVTITPYLKVYNALDRRDAFFYRSDSSDQGRPRPLAALPLLPVVGLQWRF